jgi:cation diffusion facilitator CzcD-associated flavoprotein CzcO
MTKIWDTVVIGAGQAGLASGYYLGKKGVDFLILESSSIAAGSWPNYYDSLKLFSPANYSSLPGMKFQRNILQNLMSLCTYKIILVIINFLLKQICRWKQKTIKFIQ